MTQALYQTDPRLPASRRVERDDDDQGYLAEQDATHLATTAAGAALAGYGLFRRDPLGVVLAGIGVGLAARGLFADRVVPAGGDDHASRQGGRDYRDGIGPDPSKLYEKGLHLHESVTVGKPRGELYAIWRDLTNQPRWMEHVEQVDVHGDGGIGSKSTWTVKAPFGKSYQYDAETIADEPDHLISWRTVGDTLVQHAGTAKFVDAPGGRGTEVHLEIQYLPPVGGALAGFGNKLFALVGQDPDRQVRRGLRNFQRLMETGELPTIDGQSKGTCGG